MMNYDEQIVVRCVFLWFEGGINLGCSNEESVVVEKNLQKWKQIGSKMCRKIGPKMVSESWKCNGEVQMGWRMCQKMLSEWSTKCLKCDLESAKLSNNNCLLFVFLSNEKWRKFELSL